MNAHLAVRRTISLAALALTLGAFTPARPQESAPAPITEPGSARRIEESFALADVFRRLHRAAA